MPGVARRQLTFFASPKKVSKERRPQVRRPFGVPCATRHDRPLRNSGEIEGYKRFGVVLALRTVLADCPGRACVAQRLSWGPRSINHDCRPGFSPGVRRGIRRACSAPGERQSNAMAWPKFTNFKLGPGLNPGRHCLLVTVVALRQIPVRVAEQRSKRGRGPRGLSEGEHKQDRLVGASSSPSSAAARVCEQRREARRADEPGVAFFGLPFLAKQER